jgi:flagellar hook assembly protein FlgD
VTLKIYDLLGREITTLVNEDKINGKYQTVWNGENKFGSKVSSGIYFYQLKAGNYLETKKMILLK